MNPWLILNLACGWLILVALNCAVLLILYAVVKTVTQGVHEIAARHRSASDASEGAGRAHRIL